VGVGVGGVRRPVDNKQYRETTKNFVYAQSCVPTPGTYI
jgi:hypothetical protein